MQDDTNRPQLAWQICRMYEQRFESGGDILDLDGAIRYQKDGISENSDKATKALKYAKWANLCRVRYAFRPNLEDAKTALDCNLKALPLLLNAHVLHYGAAASYDIMGEIEPVPTNREDHFNNAINNQKTGIELEKKLKHGQADPTEILNLGHYYQRRFQGTSVDKRAASDLEAAVTQKQEAVDKAPNTHSNKHKIYASFASALLLQYETHKRKGDLDKCINWLKKALDHAPANSWERSSILIELGRSYTYHYELVENPAEFRSENLQNALGSYRAAVSDDAGLPHVRIQGCLLWAKLPQSPVVPPDEAYIALQKGLDLVPQMICIGTSLSQRFHDIRYIANLATETAAYAISKGDNMKALEYFEYGRSIVWNQTMQLREPVSNISVSESSGNISKIQSLQAVAQRLFNLSKLQYDQKKADKITMKFHKWEQEYKELVTELGGRGGELGALKPKPAQEFLQGDQPWPVAMIVVHPGGCSVLMLWPNEHNAKRLTCHPLPNDAYPRIHRAYERMINAPKRSDIKDAVMTLILKDLWDAVVSPILDLLGFTQVQHVDALPHVTWCPSGILSFLPIHAAGDYSTNDKKAFKYVISSYAPTLSSLIRPLPPTTMPNKLLIVKVPGFKKPLQYAEEEVKKVFSQIPRQVKCTIRASEKGNATVGIVLNDMRQHNWVHIICHASQHETDPSESSLKLQSSELKLKDVMHIKPNNKNKGLAFLAACQTSMGDARMPNEGAHIANGMTLAGYPCVIATMWSVVDKLCPIVSEGVYKVLKRKMDYRDSAKALHVAIEALQTEQGIHLAHWVPFIHIGAKPPRQSKPSTTSGEVIPVKQPDLTLAAGPMILKSTSAKPLKPGAANEPGQIQGVENLNEPKKIPTPVSAKPGDKDIPKQSPGASSLQMKKKQSDFNGANTLAPKVAKPSDGKKPKIPSPGGTESSGAVTGGTNPRPKPSAKVTEKHSITAKQKGTVQGQPSLNQPQPLSRPPVVTSGKAPVKPVAQTFNLTKPRPAPKPPQTIPFSQQAKTPKPKPAAKVSKKDPAAATKPAVLVPPALSEPQQLPGPPPVKQKQVEPESETFDLSRPRPAPRPPQITPFSHHHRPRPPQSSIQGEPSTSKPPTEASTSPVPLATQPLPGQSENQQDHESEDPENQVKMKGKREGQK
ncbi:hypothetical protein CTheo_8512 [Ceratobasidium theobromae]|uniref:CHAT domain-containing protein n=1 Tax=Ceratobasidium theobromae TaxID=1582974 RepID=A0A5N5Q9E8_9AGAM|nr:hypothetical protein CTheo_8512 [Ceratobasidium theobromae]